MRDSRLFFGGVLLAGALFGAGLVVSGMTQPAKVLAFLDIASLADGTWDPTLAFVMGGALLVTFTGYRLVLRRKTPLCAERFQLPTKTAIDRRLVLGAALFGAGWGLAGYCPGPALASLAVPSWPLVGFLGAMVLGMIGVRLAGK